nr:EOG090X0KWJ [Leptodora kindtii]
MAAVLFGRCSTFLPLRTSWNLSSIAQYAKPAGIPSLGKKGGKGAKLGPVVEKRKIPVETDPEKLVNFVCGSNVLKQGQDIQLKPDSEYPDWLWTIRLGKPEPLEEMNPETLQYWRRLRKLSLRRQIALMRIRKF